jgi:hypothetical protein
VGSVVLDPAGNIYVFFVTQLGTPASSRPGRSRFRPILPENFFRFLPSLPFCGRYRATLVARDAAGNASNPKRLNFRVVRR